ncbi:MAG: hypothetical protein J3K34DRAFT_385264 [Monoraphidium minutum]|nr:MAG: hypothetical protein J3K34DRAFT_385264 [Monoraphidium minutum]
MEETMKLVHLLPETVRCALEAHDRLYELLEVVMDLGRPPLARFPGGDVRLSDDPVSTEDLEQAVAKVGDFGGDNRAGIDATLHRISAMRNRAGRVVGLTCRVGRAVTGSAELVRDLICSGSSILFLGRPGVGKTTAIRELSRLCADELGKRVVIVDTSNEIGGDGDVPHAGIGRARRMQVPDPEQQHRVMIEAVENHMPEVVVIDEIGTEAECSAARTIAQRGVQLIATAHGNELENVVKNPALADLVGGIQNVTLGDDEAKRRGVQKSIQERAAPATFDVAVEMLERGRWHVHPDVGAAVDAMLAGQHPGGQARERAADGSVLKYNYNPSIPGGRGAAASAAAGAAARGAGGGAARPPQPASQHLTANPAPPRGPRRLDAGRRARLCARAPQRRLTDRPHPSSSPPKVYLSQRPEGADAVLTLRARVKANTALRTAAKAAGVPVYAIKSTSTSNLIKAFRTLLGVEPTAGGFFGAAGSRGGSMDDDGGSGAAAAAAAGLEEAQLAVEQIVLPLRQTVELLPRSAGVRDAQAAMLRRYKLGVEVVGAGGDARLRVLPTAAAATAAGAPAGAEGGSAA